MLRCRHARSLSEEQRAEGCAERSPMDWGRELEPPGRASKTQSCVRRPGRGQWPCAPSSGRGHTRALAESLRVCLQAWPSQQQRATSAAD